MLSENIRTIRKSKGLSQEDLAEKIHVVRQTVSKWEQGLSVPDADLLLALSDTLETPVSTLLGETISAPETDEIKTLAEKLEALNLLLARQKERKRAALHWTLLALCGAIVLVFAALFLLRSPYQSWNYSDPETAVFGAAFHAFEYAFIRLAPAALAAAGIGAFLTRKKR